MYKSVHSFNIITSLDVSLKTCKPGSEVVQDALSGRSHLRVLSSEQYVGDPNETACNMRYLFIIACWHFNDKIAVKGMSYKSC